MTVVALKVDQKFFEELDALLDAFKNRKRSCYVNRQKVDQID